MNAQTCQASHVESPWFGGRLAAATTEATVAAIATFQSVWRAQSKSEDRARAIEMMAGIDAHTLKDIGAPDWLIAQSQERHDAHRLYLLGLYYS